MNEYRICAFGPHTHCKGGRPPETPRDAPLQGDEPVFNNPELTPKTKRVYTALGKANATLAKLRASSATLFQGLMQPTWGHHSRETGASSSTSGSSISMPSSALTHTPPLERPRLTDINAQLDMEGPTTCLENSSIPQARMCLVPCMSRHLLIASNQQYHPIRWK